MKRRRKEDIPKEGRKVGRREERKKERIKGKGGARKTKNS